MTTAQRRHVNAIIARIEDETRVQLDVRPDLPLDEQLLSLADHRNALLWLADLDEAAGRVEAAATMRRRAAAVKEAAMRLLDAVEEARA